MDKTSMDSVLSELKVRRSEGTITTLQKKPVRTRSNPGDFKQIGNEDKVDRIDKERKDTIREIVQTENLYLEDLLSLKTCFIEPIKQQKLLTKADLDTIFSNVTSICEFHQQLKNAIPDNHSQWSELGTVFIKAFLSHANFLLIYQVYCNAYKNALERVVKCEKENEKFATFLKETQALPECKNLTLQDYLIKPVQRLCKYPLLFRQLLKVTPPVHPDHKLVLDTCDKVNQVTETVNENAAEILNAERLNYMNNTVSGYMAHLNQDWYIRDGIISEEGQRGGEKIVFKERHVWLLSNALIVTRPVRIGRKKEKFLRKIDLDENASLEIGDDTDFEIVSFVDEEEVSYKFVCASPLQRTHWITDIRSQLEDRLHLKSPRNPLFVIKPGEEQTTSQIKPGVSSSFRSKKLRKRLSFKTGSPPSTGKDDVKISRSKTGQTSQRPDTSVEVAVEIVHLREEVAHFKEERESWLQREAELQERVRFLESQLYRLLVVPSSSSTEGKEMEVSEIVHNYMKFTVNFKNILGQLDNCVDKMQKREEEKAKEVEKVKT